MTYLGLFLLSLVFAEWRGTRMFAPIVARRCSR